MDAALGVFFVLMAMLLVRNELSYRWCMRRNDEIYEFNIDRINAGDYSNCLDYSKDGLDQYGLIFDLRVWTYERAMRQLEQR